MAAKSYSQLAPVYNHMMRFIDYKMWAKYIYDLSKTVSKKKKYAIELACGSGTLTKMLYKKYSFYVASDLSIPMLEQVPSAVKEKVCCNINSIPFKKKFGFAFSTFDSVNYLLTKKSFIKMLNDVADTLLDDGVFTFDVSLEKNSLKHLKYLNRQGIVKGIKYIQRSIYDPKTRVHSNHFEILLANGKKVKEIHKQKIYLFDDYFSMIDKSPFYVHACYNAFSFINANASTERAQFVLRKKKLYASI